MTFGGVAALVGLFSTGRSGWATCSPAPTASTSGVGRVRRPSSACPAPLADWAQSPTSPACPTRLSRRIAQFLAQAPQLTRRSARLARAHLAGEASAYVSPLPPVPPEMFLAGVAVVRREREFAALELEDQRLERLKPALRGMPHGFPERG